MKKYLAKAVYFPFRALGIFIYFFKMFILEPIGAMLSWLFEKVESAANSSKKQNGQDEEND